MKEMDEHFIPRLNDFSELLKRTYSYHAAQVTLLGDLQKKLKAGQAATGDPAPGEDKAPAAELLEACRGLEKMIRARQALFHQHITDTNFQLGMFGSHWGGYIEMLGVQFMLAELKRNHGMHTSIQKFKRWYHKSKNVEIDLLGISDTHLYVTEVKNQLKETTFTQMLTILEKIKEKLPEYAHLKLQPVFICVHADPAIVQTTTMGGLWIVRYKGFDDNRKHEFEWLRRDDGLEVKA